MIRKKAATKLEICILAGGLSTRMRRNKTTLRLGGRSLLSRVRALANATEFPVRIIRRDLVTRCGPLGGIITAGKTSRAQSILFLACDMPFVSQRLLHDLIRTSGGARAVFAVQNKRAGFPFIIPAAQLLHVEEQVKRGEFSLQRLAAALKARCFRVPLRSYELFNVNTPEDVVAAERLLRKTQPVSPRPARARKQTPPLVTRAVRPYGSRQ
jgi:molybdopterin-guanine dinucleotide biosynthesis protein A